MLGPTRAPRTQLTVVCHTHQKHAASTYSPLCALPSNSTPAARSDTLLLRLQRAVEDVKHDLADDTFAKLEFEEQVSTDTAAQPTIPAAAAAAAAAAAEPSLSFCRAPFPHASRIMRVHNPNVNHTTDTARLRRSAPLQTHWPTVCTPLCATVSSRRGADKLVERSNRHSEVVLVRDLISSIRASTEVP